MFWTPAQSQAPEWMDGDSYSEEDLKCSLDDLRWINRCLGGYAVILKNLGGLIQKKKLTEFSILDAATGSGDIPLAITKWARRHSLKVSILGVDKNTRTIEIAKKQAKDYPEIQYQACDFFELSEEKYSFDFCISSLFLHHLTPDQVSVFLNRMLLLSRHAVLINDLVRSWIAYAGYRLISKCVRLHNMTQHDGAVSVLRSYTVPQLYDLLKSKGFANFAIRRHFPYRLCLILEK